MVYSDIAAYMYVIYIRTHKASLRREMANYEIPGHIFRTLLPAAIYIYTYIHICIYIPPAVWMKILGAAGW